ncbi:MAG: NUDIX hydrolase [Candidatus Hydrothermarchaeota archaeon]
MEYPNMPVVGVGAVVVKNNKILLVKRGKDPRKGYWAIPGGVLELGETIEDAIKREVEEETNVKIEVVRLIDVLEDIILDHQGNVRFHYVLVDYLSKYKEGELRAGSDVLDAKWLRIDDLDKFKVAETTKEVIKKALYKTNIAK